LGALGSVARIKRSLSAALLLASATAVAATEEAPTLSRDQLAACLADERALRLNNDALDLLKQALQSQLDELHARETRLDASRTRLDATDTAAVETYNALIDEHARRAETYNATLPGINIEIESLNAARRDIDARCAHHAYDARDMEALRGAHAK